MAEAFGRAKNVGAGGGIAVADLRPQVSAMSFASLLCLVNHAEGLKVDNREVVVT